MQLFFYISLIIAFFDFLFKCYGIIWVYSYDIKNDIVDENNKEILTQTNNLIYEKIKSHFKINPQDFDLNINHYKNQKNEYLESLEIENIIKKINK